MPDRKRPAPRSALSQKTSAKKMPANRKAIVAAFPPESASFQEWDVAADKIRIEANQCWRVWANTGYTSGSQAEAELIASRSRFEYALDRAYPRGFWEAMQSISESGTGDAEPILRFLEADPWFYRSGYVKASATTALKHVPLTVGDKGRVQELLLNVVDSRFRREFRYYCRLARVVQTEWFIEQLNDRLNGFNADSALRAKWMLAVCIQR